jgi:hypothetical protein
VRPSSAARRLPSFPTASTARLSRASDRVRAPR